VSVDRFPVGAGADPARDAAAHGAAEDPDDTCALEDDAIHHDAGNAGHSRDPSDARRPWNTRYACDASHARHARDPGIARWHGRAA
jgi:hypothetical protein